VADLGKIRLLTYSIPSLRPCQPPLKVSNETNNYLECTLCTDRNLQRHRAISLRQHGFLVKILLLAHSAVKIYNKVNIEHSITTQQLRYTTL